MVVKSDPGIEPRSAKADLLKVIEKAEKTENVCFECRGLIPKRGRHCYICRACIRKFDHHCFYIDNCVGEGNDRLFLLMLTVLLINGVLHLII